MDTIFAVSTPPGRAGVAVIRVSGPNVGDVCDRLELGDLTSHKAVVRNIRDGDAVLDQALVLRFDKGASFTGEEALELQIHGSNSRLRLPLSRRKGCQKELDCPAISP